MKLTFEQIKSITSGAERIEENGGTVSFFRFTKAEEKAYAESWLYPRTFATSGIKLHFKTDAKAMDLKIRATEIGYHTLYAFDIYENKKLIGQIKNYPEGTGRGDREKNEYPVGDAEGHFVLGEGKKEIEIYFPWSVKGELLELSLECDTCFAPVKYNKECLVYGDSITQGATALSPSNAYIVKTSDWLDAEIISKAIGSEAYFPELVDGISGERKPDYIIASYGVNDWVLRTYEEAEEKCREFWKKVTEAFPSAKKFALTPIWYENKNIEAKLGNFSLIEKFITKVASEFDDVTVINCEKFVPENGLLFDDGIHPTDEGFNFFYKNLIAELEKHI